MPMIRFIKRSAGGQGNAKGRKGLNSSLIFALPIVKMVLTADRCETVSKPKQHQGKFLIRAGQSGGLGDCKALYSAATLGFCPVVWFWYAENRPPLLSPLVRRFCHRRDGGDGATQR